MWILTEAFKSSLFLLNQVQNGVAVYATWGTISTLLNLTIYLQYQTPTSKCDCAMLSLMLILMELLAWWVSFPAVFCPLTFLCFTEELLSWANFDFQSIWKGPDSCLFFPFCFCIRFKFFHFYSPRFLLENFYLDEHVRYIVTIYPVAIVWLTGALTNFGTTEHHVYIFTGTAYWCGFENCLTLSGSLYNLISPLLFSFNPGDILHHVCGTHHPRHMEAPQEATLQWQ